MNTNDPPPPTSPSITMQPTNQSVTVGQTATFTVTASGASPLAYQWHKNGASIPGATSATYVTPSATTGDNGSSFNVAVSNSLGSVTSSSATLTVNSMPAPTTDVLTYHYDNMRTGQNLNETVLTPANVNTAKFGKLGEFTVDGKVDGQPLYLTNLSIPNKGTKNVLYVVTEHDSVFAFDADSASGSTSSFLWMTSTLQPGETPSDDHHCNQVTPEIGITSTPVIDRVRGAIYVIALSKNAMGNYIFRIHALDLTTGKERFGGPFAISATFTGSGSTVSFDPAQYNERPGLLEVNGTIYTTWGSHCDSAPYTSWIMSFSADTLAQTGVLNLEPNGSEGGIWMSGGAPAADSSGNIYFIVGNGTFDTSLTPGGLPSKGDCGNCFAKISSSTPLQLLDYFTPLNTVSESAADVDFGSGGPLLLPDVTDSTGKTHHLAIGAGKDTNMYIVDRDNMGKFNATRDNIYQLITGQLASRVDSKPSYFNGTVYYCAVSDFLKAYPIVNGQLAGAPSSRTANTFQFPGATPTISASNSTTNGVVWAVENGTNLPAVLHAYDATNLATEFYNSNQAANGRDQFSGNKFITPLVVNGKVYVGTPRSVAVFGLLP